MEDKKGCCAMPSENSCPTGDKGGCCGPKKCCMKTCIAAALAGAIVMFIYFAASWMLLPWHKTTMMSFTNEGAVATVLSENAAQSGVYTLPAMPKDAASKPEMTKPFAFVSVFADGVDWKNQSPLPCMLKAFLLYFFGAAMLAKILKKSLMTGCCPVGCAMMTGLLVALFAYVPNMIWFHFPLCWSLLGMADIVIAFTLAGAAIKCILKCGPCTKAGGCCPGGTCGPTAGSCDDKSEKKTGCCM